MVYLPKPEYIEDIKLPLAHFSYNTFGSHFTEENLSEVRQKFNLLKIKDLYRTESNKFHNTLLLTIHRA